MSYIESSLVQGETVVATATLHWTLFSGGITFTVLGILLLDVPELAVTLWLLAGVVGFFKLITYLTSEIGLTDQRVLAKVGFVRRSTMDLMLNRVESIRVKQGMLGRLLGYGRLITVGYQNMASPEAFAQKVRALLST